MNNNLERIKNICNGIEYSRDVPEEAKQIAKENNIVIIVGGSDDLMYCYGTDCYLTRECEHSYGWDGDTLKDIFDEQLENEAEQLGLMIWWCGSIASAGLEKENYSTEENGAFSYSVNDCIEYAEFKVCENENDFSDIYCTGIIIQLPDNFIKYKVVTELPDTKITEFKSNYQKLFNHMHNEHGLTLLESEMDEIIHIVNKMQK